MQKANVANAIVWVRKHLVTVSLIFALAATGYGLYNSPPQQNCSLVIKQQCIDFEVANNDTARQKGLSGRSDLSANKAMLFVFPQPGDHCFWMKDMNFAIDMVWIDAEKKVIYTKQNVSPDTYPDSFCPSADATYVLELKAGRSVELGIGEGTSLIF